MSAQHRTDRRVRRTQALLHEALLALIHEKAYDAIVVKEILARANVGRSTFYAHFRDKDELLERGVREMVDASTAAGARTRSHSRVDHLLRFSLPILTHVERYRVARSPAEGPPRQDAVHARLQRALAELVAHDLATAPDRELAPKVPRELLAEHVAATFVRVLDWWVGGDGTLSAREADELFRALAGPALEKA